MRPYLPELTIRDYNTYQWYQRGVRRQLYTTYGLYSCYGLRYNGVLFAVLADSLAGRPATCKQMREPGILCRYEHNTRIRQLYNRYYTINYFTIIPVFLSLKIATSIRKMIPRISCCNCVGIISITRPLESTLYVITPRMML